MKIIEAYWDNDMNDTFQPNDHGSYPGIRYRLHSIRIVYPINSLDILMIKVLSFQ